MIGTVRPGGIDWPGLQPHLQYQQDSNRLVDRSDLLVKPFSSRGNKIVTNIVPPSSTSNPSGAVILPEPRSGQRDPGNGTHGTNRSTGERRSSRSPSAVLWSDGGPSNPLLYLAGVVTATLVVLAFALQPASQPLVKLVGFIGDSYTAGSDLGGRGDANITSLLGQRFGWQTVNAAVGGTGYVNSGPSGQNRAPFEAAQLDRIVAAQPSAVVISGSRNDIGEPGVRDAAGRLYSNLKAKLPNTKLIVVGPAWVNGNPPEGLLDVRDNVRDAARQAGITFIDPIAEGWFASSDASLIGSDGVHPTDAGHQRMAQLLGDDLQQAGINGR